jgi:hypothetical protein
MCDSLNFNTCANTDNKGKFSGNRLPVTGSRISPLYCRSVVGKAKMDQHQKLNYMNIKSTLIQSHGFKIPSIIIESDNSLGLVIIIHGYGGSKEEQLGLGWRVSEAGFSSCMIDLPGHGDNMDYFDGDIQTYIESLFDYFNNYKNIIVLGHSIGGRLALTSKAKYVIGISPTLFKDFSNETKSFIKNIRSYRVRERDDGFLWTLHQHLPLFDLNENKNFLIIYGTRDVSEISSYCKNLQQVSTKVIEIEKAMHNDIYLNTKTFEIIIDQLKKWHDKKPRPQHAV